MGASLGPVLANIILTELEKVVVKPLIDSGMLKFYIRYVDDTLVLMKRSDLDHVLRKLNSFHRNLKFTVDDFSDSNVHFLDLLIKKKFYRRLLQRHPYRTVHPLQLIHPMEATNCMDQVLIPPGFKDLQQSRLARQTSQQHQEIHVMEWISGVRSQILD